MIHRLGAIAIALFFLVSPVAAETITVPNGGNLQTALTAAKPGDVIILTAGATYTGNFVLPVKPDGTVITVRTSADLPERRITPADFQLLPTIRSGNGGSAITGTGTSNWVLLGLRFEANLNGANNLISLQDVENVTIDRMLFEAPPLVGQRRAVMGNGKNVTLIRSHIAGVWAQSLQDSQAFCAWDGAGPYKVIDNYLEAASENVMFGGANSKSPDRIPADILVERNHMSKPLEWKGKSRAVKNLFELKSAKRVIVRDNLFEHNWAQAQNGYAILFTVRNDEGGSPWSVVEDVLFERNIVRDTQNGINILGIDTYQPSGMATRIKVRNNIIQTSGTAFQIGGEAGEIELSHNTVINGWSFMFLYKGDVRDARDGGTLRRGAHAAEALTVINNLGYHREYGVIGDSTGIGTAALDAMVLKHLWTHNVLAGGNLAHKYPGLTLRPSVEAHEAQFNSDFSLLPTSVYRGAGNDGTDLGAVMTTPEPEPEPGPAPEPVVTEAQLKAALTQLHTDLWGEVDRAISELRGVTFAKIDKLEAENLALKDAVSAMEAAMAIQQQNLQLLTAYIDQIISQLKALPSR